MPAQIYVHHAHCLRRSKHFTSSIYGWLYSCLPFSCKIYRFSLTVPDIISIVPDLFVVLYFEIKWPWLYGKGKCMYILRIKQCLCHDFNRQAWIKFKSEFEKIGETGKYFGMWKLKKLCICVSLAQNIHIWCLWKIFHTTAEDKRRESKHMIIHTPHCKSCRRPKSVRMHE